MKSTCPEIYAASWRTLHSHRHTSSNEIDLDFETYCFFLTRHPGLRKVRPYYFTFTTFTKGRWAKCWNIKMTFKTDKKMRKPHTLVRKRKLKSIWSENSKFPLWRNVSWWVGFTICHFDQQVSSHPPPPCKYFGEYITHKEGNPIRVHFKLILWLDFFDENCINLSIVCIIFNWTGALMHQIEGPLLDPVSQVTQDSS